MAYTNQPSLKQRSAGIAGVVIVHVAMGTALIVGLAVQYTPSIVTGPITPIDYSTPTPEPTPEPVEEAKPTSQNPKVIDPIVSPPAPDPIIFDPGALQPITTLPPGSNEIMFEIPPLNPGGTGDGVTSEYAQTTKPLPAKPRNRASRWVTDNDYKPRWVREGLSGTARFTLDIDAKGRVSNCTITQSTGHAALDRATCTLIRERARFNPALDEAESPTGGVYSSAITWQLPN